MTEEQKASVKRGMSEWIFTGVHPGITPDPEVNCQLDHLILGTDKWDDLSNTNKDTVVKSFC